ncbi:acyl-CoA dehydrogenase family protein [Massilia sp. MB5]|uniref:acyl-CoA dehydrogenase family protein n=1 Tax=unclassified Massilia TaxID=2609279 RepID=UPI00067B1CEE|nr:MULTISPECIES: acyl-CoA dehydrogenase family protein [unclassified Massilia]AKU20914.1 acyl-CoA dehydrogenase [Massilia sp. NR 4-1]UMR29543.1 acyl-CoA dehydrogenase family protein [Massilia sp. MB5]
MDAKTRLMHKQAEFRRFALEHVAPYAAVHDRTEAISGHTVPSLAQHGYLAPFLPPQWQGAGMDMLTLGALHEEIGRACSAVRSLLTVHGMAAHAILRWGSAEQRERWLAALAAGRVLGALAVSEPNAGSDIGGVETEARPAGEGFVLNGRKKWITCGQLAGVFIVLAHSEGKPVAFAVDRASPGLRVEALQGVTGTRGSMLALLSFEDCFVHRREMLGRPGFGNVVALSALGFGRYSVACGSVGIAQACLDASLAYADKTVRFGAALREHQLIQQMITDMVTDIAAARLLCQSAGAMIDDKDAREIQHTFIAKYYASTAAMRAANNAVQIHGANGCSSDYPVERYMRDAKVMEIIEGSTQIQQTTIAGLEFQEFERRRRAAPAAAAPAAPSDAGLACL